MNRHTASSIAPRSLSMLSVSAVVVGVVVNVVVVGVMEAMR